MKRALLMVLIGAMLLAAAGLSETAAPDDAAETAAPDDAEEAADQLPPAPGYVLVTTATRSGWLPLPEEGEYTYHLRQIMSDGTLADNAIHVFPEGVYMEDSTCENHDCIQQGEVTLTNRSDRILGSMIICLPNQVMLELYTPEEAQALMEKDQGQ